MVLFDYPVVLGTHHAVGPFLSHILQFFLQFSSECAVFFLQVACSVLSQYFFMHLSTYLHLLRLFDTKFHNSILLILGVTFKPLAFKFIYFSFHLQIYKSYCNIRSSSEMMVSKSKSLLSEHIMCRS